MYFSVWFFKYSILSKTNLRIEVGDIMIDIRDNWTYTSRRVRHYLIHVGPAHFVRVTDFECQTFLGKVTFYMHEYDVCKQQSWHLLGLLVFILIIIVLTACILQDQARSISMIESDPELSSLTMIYAPLVDVEIRGVPALQFLGDIVWKWKLARIQTYFKTKIKSWT